MRILKVTQAYYPFLEMGGPTVKVRALARGLAAAGHEVTVLTADLGLDAGMQRITAATIGGWGYETQEENVHALYLRTLAQYRAITWNPEAGAFCRERLASFDVVHIYGLYDLLGPVVARACRHLGRPYVLEPMGMFRPIVRSLWLKRSYHATLGGPMLRGAARLIATSEQERGELSQGGFASGTIVVRRNGIDAPAELPRRGSFREHWNISPQAKVVLFLGRLVSKKSPELLLEAFARWRPGSLDGQGAVLVLAGPHEGDGFRQRLEALSVQAGLQDCVRFTGPLYDHAKWAAYQDADVFVLPSVNENFGNTAAEAIACGTPVLVTDQCGIAPWVDQRAGLVVPHGLASLTAGLARILEDQDLASRLRAGCAAVGRSLSWAEPLSQMERIYKDVVVEPAV